MDRKWRTNRSAIDTVLSFPDFVRQVGPWKEGYKVASLTDLYAVYTVLHIEDKEWEIKWSESAQIYYFIAKQTIEQGVETKASAPEGDEDVPELVMEPEDEIALTGYDDKKYEYSTTVQGNRTEKQGLNNVRTQLIVPLSSSYPDLTPLTLQRFFRVQGEEVQQLLLGLVDSNGVVSRSSLFNYIQSPLEGPGTAILDLSGNL